MKSNISKRKTDHLRLAANAQLQKRDRNFSDYDLTYEPCLGIFPADNFNLKQTIGHKSIDHPLWISSMTGGSAESGKINKILAKIAHEWGLGMGLGSCRILMDNPKNIKDFQLRPILKDRPLWANLGICQVDEFNRQNNWKKFQHILEDLDVDGLMIHINPTQEFLQKEGSTLKHSAIDILTSFFSKDVSLPIIVKEVGQGMGPQSLKALSQLPLAGIEFASLGGTNFATLELLRETTTQDSLDPLISLTKLGHSAKEMIDFWTSFQTDKRAKSLASWHVIISGGRGHDVIDDVVLFKKIQKNHQCSIGLGYSILAQAYRGEKKAMEWLRKYIKTFYFINNFTTLKSS